MSLSYSKYSTYKKCPRQYKYRYIDKVPTPPSDHPAMARGQEIHKSIEDFLRGNTEQLHPDIHSYYGMFLTTIRQAGALPEVQIAVDRNWNLVPWDAPECYFRAVIDAHIPDSNGKVLVYEWKTGKIYPDHYDQRELYGMMLISLYPKAEEVLTIGVYVDLKKNSVPTQHPAGYQQIKVPKWREEFDQVLNDEHFMANPSFGCRFCPFRREIGGPCEF